MSGRIAIVLFVKDEVVDLPAWLAWYLLIGANTILVYDDHSTDGTWELINAAARRFDVRPFRTDLEIRPFTARQREAYLDAIRNYRKEFEWIGFFDADEFLHLQDGLELGDFLSRFPHAGAVAINWCIYGSNGHLLKPTTTTIEAFTRHSEPSFEHNRSVKSFVRADFVLPNWRDPHTFDVGERPYLDAAGRPISWGGPGAIAHEPNWSVAKLMHFIPRSMEHFVERIRRRSDLRGLTNEYWGVFNKNDREDKDPLQRLPGLFKIIFAIEQQLMESFCQEAALLHLRSPQPEFAAAASNLTIEYFTVETSFSTILSVDAENNVVHVDKDQIASGEFSPVKLATSPAVGSPILLLDSTGKTPLNIPHDPRISTVLPFRKSSDLAGDTITLKHPYLERFLTASPKEASGSGRTSLDRRRASEWETFKLIPTIGSSSQDALYPRIDMALNASLNTIDILQMASVSGTGMVCAAAIQLLHGDERAKISKLIASPTPRWV